MSSQLYPIRYFGDPILRRVCHDVNDFSQDFQVPNYEPVNLTQLSRNMFETMYEAFGVGLAAPQIGLPIRMFVAAEYNDDIPEGEKPSLKERVQREFVMINPSLEVLDIAQTSNHLDGCLSMPGIFEEGVLRHHAVKMTYFDLDGQKQVLEADDYLARVFQHEADHLDGKLFIDYLPRSIMQKYRPELAEFQREAKAYLKYIKAKM